MSHHASDAYQWHCNHCHWRSPIQHAQVDSSMCTPSCPICVQNALQAHKISVLDWLFDYAAQHNALSKTTIDRADSAATAEC